MDFIGVIMAATSVSPAKSAKVSQRRSKIMRIIAPIATQRLVFLFFLSESDIIVIYFKFITMYFCPFIINNTFEIDFVCKKKKVTFAIDMKSSAVIRFVILGVIWIALVAMLIARTQITLYTIFVVLASGIVVFVPLYKKYVKNDKS